MGQKNTVLSDIDLPAIAASRQLLLVIGTDWADRTAQLQRFERTNLANDWQPVGDLLAVSIGRSGLAWGRGRHPEVDGVGPIKREGDGCAPAGVFEIRSLFGNFTPDSAFARAAKLAYLPATGNLKAIDDPASHYYNQIVDQFEVPEPDWHSCEEMLRSDQCYAVGAVVAHNCEPALPGAGSCIFLHVWDSAGAATAGCTAMSLSDMTAIAGWLDAAAAPLLVQLPQAEYERLREAWGLPTCLMSMR